MKRLIVLLALLARIVLADDVALLSTAIDAAQARHDLIVSAQPGDELCVSTFIFGGAGDKVAMAHLALLRDAARRGVKVKLLVDAENNHIPKPLFRHLLTDAASHGNFEVKVFAPVTAMRPWEYMFRLHDKLLIRRSADGKRTQTITGGRNIDERYFGLGHEPIRDADIYVEGKQSAEAHRYFSEVWASRRTAVPQAVDSKMDWFAKLKHDLIDRIFFGARGSFPRALSRLPRGEVVRHGALLDTSFANLRRDFPALRIEGERPWRKGIRTVDSVQFIANPLAIRKQGHGTLIDLIRNAKKSVVIVNPYVIPTPNMMNAIAEARRRGVRVEILTNNGPYTDIPIARAGFENAAPWLLEHGVELRQAERGGSLHEKTAVIDDVLSYIGTFNLDGRSEFFNQEQGFIVTDRTFAQGLLRSIERDRVLSRTTKSVADTRQLRGCFGALSRLAAVVVKDGI